MKVFAETHRAH